MLVRILQMPFEGDELWRHAIIGACNQRGWAYHEYWGGEPPHIDPEVSAVVIGWDPGAIGVEADHWAVQRAEPHHSLAVFQSRLNWNDQDAAYYISYRLAVATQLASSGAPVSSSSDAYLEVPGLGRVEAPAGRPQAVSAKTDGPLALYALEQVGRPCVEWPAELFNYPIGKEPAGGPNPISLLSRRRLLLNGPNIWLPSGVWQVRASFELDPKDRADLLIEWGHGVETAKFAQIIDHPGKYELELTHRWVDPAPADFRISLMMPELDGTLNFLGVEVYEISDPDAVAVTQAD